jgi:hypothetical protein
MRSRRGRIVALLSLGGCLIGCARLVGLDELQDEPQASEACCSLGSDAGSPAAGAGGTSGGAAPVGQAGSAGDVSGSAGLGAGGSESTPTVPDLAAVSDSAGLGGSPGSAGSPGASADASGAAGSTDVSGSPGAAGASGAPGSAGGLVLSSCPGNLLVNGGFEAGPEAWVSFTTGVDPLIYDATLPIYEGVTPHGGQWLGWLGGVPSETNRLSQTVAVPAAATRVELQGSLRVQLLEEHPQIDYLRIRLVFATGPVPLGQWTQADVGTDWVDLTLPPVELVPSAQPVSVTVEIESEIGAGPGTYFYVDDLALVATCPP